MAARRLTLLVTVPLALLLSGCSTAPGDPLSGRIFVSDTVTGRELVPGTQITLTFERSQIGADAGCNHMGGSYTLTGSTLTVGTLSTTEMGCLPTTKMDQDQWLADLLTSGPTYSLSGDTLTLTSGSTRITLRQQTSTPLPLEATHWELNTIVTGTGPGAAAEDATLPTNPATLTVLNGTVPLNAGVNGGSGPVTVTATTITFGHLNLTLRPIQNDRRGQIETAVLSVLTGTVTYSITGDSLTITAQDGSHGLVYRAVAVDPAPQ